MDKHIGNERNDQALSDEQLDQASGGFLHWLFPAYAVDKTFGDSMRTLSDAMGGSSNVMAGPDGEGDYKIGAPFN